MVEISGPGSDELASAVREANVGSAGMRAGTGSWNGVTFQQTGQPDADDMRRPVTQPGRRTQADPQAVARQPRFDLPGWRNRLPLIHMLPHIGRIGSGSARHPESLSTPPRLAKLLTLCPAAPHLTTSAVANHICNGP
jgi:hypothetical protein